MIPTPGRFHDRREAGRLLATRLERLRGEQPIVLALPRGGVPIGFEIATALGAPLDVLAVRKLGAPGQPEYAIGAIAEGGARIVNPDALARLGVGPDELGELLAREDAELRRRVQRYRGSRPPLELAGHTVIVADDGVATGLTDLAALHAIRRAGPRRVVLAVPVCAAQSAALLREAADEVVALVAPVELDGVGRWYEDFGEVPDREVLALLAAAGSEEGAPPAEEVAIPAHGALLRGDLRRVERPRGIVVFAHGSGSSRRSARNVQVATGLWHAGFATLLFDLLTPAEAADRANVFDVELLAERLAAAIRWTRGQPALGGVRLGCFGASTGAAAALIAAARLPGDVAAVVSRGGRPDLAGAALAHVHAPTLLIVGGEDRQVLELNRRAMATLRGPRELAIVPGAGHLFEEPGTLEALGDLAANWFGRHLAGAHAPALKAG